MNNFDDKNNVNSDNGVNDDTVSDLEFNNDSVDDSEKTLPAKSYESQEGENGGSAPYGSQSYNWATHPNTSNSDVSEANSSHQNYFGTSPVAPVNFYGYQDSDPVKASVPPVNENRKALNNLKLLGALIAVIAVGGISGYAGSSIANDRGSVNYTQSIQSAPGGASNVVDKNTNWTNVINNVSNTIANITIQTAQGDGSGSGVIISSDGLILTNNHVVESATKISVTLSDGNIYEANVRGTDPITDLAVIELASPPNNLRAAVFADSDNVKVGDTVAAIGNPLGLSQTATTGIVSSLNRPVTTSLSSDGSIVSTNAIQVDASINPGNSGGPLFNSNGEVIGITSSIATLGNSSIGGQAQSGSIGLGFAIPSHQAKMIGDQLIKNRTAKHAYLGVMAQDSIAELNGVQRMGAKIQGINDDSPAAKAGLKKGDVVTKIDNHQVAGSASLTGFVRTYTIGTDVDMTVVRNNSEKRVKVKLGELKSDSFKGVTPTPSPSQRAEPQS